MKHRYLLSCGLTVVSALGLVSPTPGIEPPFEMEEVAEGIYSVRRKFAGSNAAVIINDRDVLVVDSHVSPAAARGTLQAVREITDRPVRYVVNTHWHTDHFVGNQAYLDAFPGQVEFISHRTVREDIPSLAPEQLTVAVRYVREDVEMATRMLMGGTDEHHRPITPEQSDRLRRFVEDQSKSLGELESQRFILPDLTIERGLTLHRDERQIQILFLGRGHTRGDLVVYLPRERIVVTGDLLTHPTLHIGSSSRPVEWLDSLRALDQLEFDIALPGHGAVIRNRDYLELMILLLEAVIEQVRAGLDEELELAEIEAGIDVDQLEEEWVGDVRARAETFERARELIPDAVGRAYLELTGRLD